jgi:DNA processing protein
MEPLAYEVALTLLPGVGDILAKNLVSYCGSPQGVFNAPKTKLLKVPGIGRKTAQAIAGHKVFERALEEVEFIRKKKLRTFFYHEKIYPSRLTHCADSPLLLYGLGTFDPNAPRIVGIVGTRNATAYGKEMVKQIIADLAPYKPVIVSGLAYGIDIAAHRAALSAGLSTLAVLAHGLDRIYPGVHKDTARKMLKQGGLITEYPSQTNPDAENFPQRNRIIAGLVDALIVVESDLKGGAVITADVANSYDREVYAVPGRLGDPWSRGCNFLIQTNRASIYTGVDQLAENLRWELKQRAPEKQRKLLLNLTDDQKKVVATLKETDSISSDDLAIRTGFPPSKVAAVTLELEFEGVIKALPGSRFALN